MSISELISVSNGKKTTEEISFNVVDKQYNIICTIPRVYELTCTDNEMAPHEISFKVYNTKEENSEYWCNIKDLAIIQAVELDEYYEIIITNADESSSYKTIVGTSLAHRELSDIKLYDLEINTKADILRDDYTIPTVFYKDKDHTNSLLHRIFEKAPHYKIEYVDVSLWNIQRSYSVSGTSIYDFTNTDISQEINCIFKYNSKTRTISVYDLLNYCYDCGERGEFEDTCPKCGGKLIKQGYGDDTTILISTSNLSDSITLTSSVDDFKNCFKLKAGDDIMTSTVRSLNPSGTDYLMYFSEESLKLMPPTLSSKLIDYDNEYKKIVELYVPDLENNKYIPLYASIIDKYNADEYANYKYNDDNEKVLTNNSFLKLDATVIGHSKLINVYYDAIDIKLYLESGLMPRIGDDPTVDNQIIKLTESALNPIGLTKVDEFTSSQTAETAVKNYAKLLIDKGFKIEVNTSSFEYIGTDDEEYAYGYWYGTITLSSFKDASISKTTEILKIKVWNNYANYIEQKIKKTLNENTSESGSVFDIINIDDLDEFRAVLIFYSLKRLESFKDAYQSALDVLIEADQATPSADMYNVLYLPYLIKSRAIENEIKTRKQEIEICSNILIYLDEQKAIIQKNLDINEYLGDDLWLVFNAYRREGEYTNENYISNGLSNADIIKKANEFYNQALKEVKKNAKVKYSISVSLNDNLVDEKLKYISNNLKLGNYVRAEVNDDIHKLRLSSITLSEADNNPIQLQFSSVVDVDNLLGDVQSLLGQAKSVTSQFSYLTHQVENTNENNKILNSWIDNGFDATANKIVNSASNQNVVFNQNGILCRYYDDLNGDFTPEQLKIINSTLAITDDNWETVKAAIGKYYYKDPLTGEMKVTYGVLGDSIIGKMILGETLGIYDSETDQSMSFDKNGLVLNTSSKNGYKKIFEIRKDGIPQLYIDNDGNLVIVGMDILIENVSELQESLSKTNKEVSSLKVEQGKISQSVTEIEEEIKDIDFSNYHAGINCTGNSITNEVKSITLSAALINGSTETETLDSCFQWRRESGNSIADNTWNNAHKSIKKIILTSGDLGTSANFYCTVTTATWSGKTSAITITDDTKIPKLSSSFLDVTGAPQVQTLDTDNNYSPSWIESNPVITPAIVDGLISVQLDRCTITFKRVIGGAEQPLVDGETVINGVLKISKNIMSKTLPTVTYVCYVTYKNISIKLFTSFTLNIVGKDGADGSAGLNGKDGAQGIPGKNGIDGKTSYTHIAYANSADGKTDFSINDSDRGYIGMYVDFVANDSTDYTKYAWSKIKGADGTNGVAGKPGIDGKTPYLHIAYANNATGTSGFSTTDSVNKLYIGTYTDYTEADSTDPTKYSWTLTKGEQGAKGKEPKLEQILFAISTSKTVAPTTGWNTTQPLWSSGNYLWKKRKITYTDNTVLETNPEVDSSWEAVNDIEPGDRNLVLKSNANIEIGTGYNIIQGKLSQDWIVGETYTAVIKGKIVNSNATGGLRLWRDQGNVGISIPMPYNAEKGLYIATFKCPNPYTGHTVFNLFSLYNYPSSTAVSAQIEWIKIVRGNKVSFDWTPAPEDIQEDIDTSKEQLTTMFNSSIEQTKKEINLQVKSVLESVGANASAISSISNEIKLTNEATSFIKTTVDKLQGVVDGKVDEKTIQEWARFDGASLELGASNSMFKAILTNTELGFYQSGNKIAWISNNELHILKAAIEVSLSIGNFVLSFDSVLGFTIS